MKGGNNNEKQQQELYTYCAGYTRISTESRVARGGGEWVGGIMFQHFQLFPNVFVLRFYLLYPGLSNMSGYIIHPTGWGFESSEITQSSIKYRIHLAICISPNLIHLGPSPNPRPRKDVWNFRRIFTEIEMPALIVLLLGSWFWVNFGISFLNKTER